MSKFESLTQYLPQLEEDEIGTWFIDRENDGTPEHPIQMPYVNYTKTVDSFVHDVYAFMDANPDYELNRYGEILEQNGLEWNSQSMKEADVTGLEARCVMALIMGAIRAERFCDGALLGFFRDGCIKKWLERLKEIDGDATGEEE
jgi:hypothetical protein